MGRPTIARSIKRRRLRELGEQHLNAGAVAPCASESIENQRALIEENQRQQMVCEELDAIELLKARGYSIASKKPKAKSKKASKNFGRKSK